jgi:hypothetical protein
MSPKEKAATRHYGNKVWQQIAGKSDASGIEWAKRAEPHTGPVPVGNQFVNLGGID